MSAVEEWTCLDGKNLGSETVQILATKDWIYAAGEGEVARIDPRDGKEHARKRLSPSSRSAVTLATTANGQIIAGELGSVYGLDPLSLQQQWKNPLSGYGYQHITLLANGNDIYMGTNGYLATLDANDGGKIKKENGLKGYGKELISLALNADRSRLFLGTNGYLVSLRTDNLDIQWYAGLWTGVPHDDWSVEIALDEPRGQIYAGSNGCFSVVGLEGDKRFLTRLKFNAGHVTVASIPEKPMALVAIQERVQQRSIASMPPDVIWSGELSGIVVNRTDILHMNGRTFFHIQGQIWELTAENKLEARLQVKQHPDKRWKKMQFFPLPEQGKFLWGYDGYYGCVKLT
ncbi:hypothetical protein DFH08DRAFT_846230 [Mycena albidolilacea]|uniref:Uncharacterized protein n=1 Tax=Mycena albidolilacea TaxID=1033008 RepID=A0AAD7F0U4_9AGAR|nr:hypothetical protein DFH08DRAFT_846230 [Mycena albidolilacea]